MPKYVMAIRIITDRKVGFEFKNRNLEFLNQRIFILFYSNHRARTLGQTPLFRHTLVQGKHHFQ